MVLYWVPGGAEMPEISARFHFSNIFDQKVRAKAKKKPTCGTSPFFCINNLEIIVCDAKKTSHSESVSFFGLCPNFLAKNDRKVKFCKNVRLGSKSMKKVFGRNFCHFRAPWDPTKYRKSPQNGVF